MGFSFLTQELAIDLGTANTVWTSRVSWLSTTTQANSWPWDTRPSSYRTGKIQE